MNTQPTKSEHWQIAELEPAQNNSQLVSKAFMFLMSESFSSDETFRALCSKVVDAWSGLESIHQVSKKGGEQFERLLGRITAGGDNIITTPWGGVVVELNDHPNVEKYLVVKSGAHLAFEKHELKEEHLEVREGLGLLIYRKPDDVGLSVKFLESGVTCSFNPGQEHCIIALENLVVYERSTDPKGMDKDLIFIYT